MSYEHCDIHNEEATNGCRSCMLADVIVAKGRLKKAALEYAIGTESEQALLSTAEEYARFARDFHDAFGEIP